MHRASCPIIYSLEVRSSCANRHIFLLTCPPEILGGVQKLTTVHIETVSISRLLMLRSCEVTASASGDVKSSTTWLRPWTQSCLWGCKACSFNSMSVICVPLCQTSCPRRTVHFTTTWWFKCGGQWNNIIFTISIIDLTVRIWKFPHFAKKGFLASAYQDKPPLYKREPIFKITPQESHFGSLFFISAIITEHRWTIEVFFLSWFQLPAHQDIETGDCPRKNRICPLHCGQLVSNSYYLFLKPLYIHLQKKA